MYRQALRTVTRTSALRPMAARSFATASAPAFDWQDPLAAKNLYTEDEIAIGETAERYCQERMLPRVLRTTTP